MELIQTYVDRIQPEIDQVCLYIDDKYAYSCDCVIEDGSKIVTENSKLILDHERVFDFYESFNFGSDDCKITSRISYQIPSIVKSPWTNLTDLRKGDNIAFGTYEPKRKAVLHSTGEFVSYDAHYVHYRIPYAMYPTNKLINHLLYISPI